MTEELLKQRKEMLVQLVHDKTYVPMKLKELAMLLSVPKEQRDELKEVLDILIAEGKTEFLRKENTARPRNLHWLELLAAMQRASAL